MYLFIYLFIFKALSPGCAPSILITFIGMVLFKYDKSALQGCETPYMFSGQVRNLESI